MKSNKRNIGKFLFIFLCIVGTKTWAKSASKEITLLCQSTVYSITDVQHERKGVENGFELKLCALDSSEECASQNVEIRGMNKNYLFGAYLRNNRGQKPEVNITFWDLTEGIPISLASRDLIKSGFLSSKIGDRIAMVGCSIR